MQITAEELDASGIPAREADRLERTCALVPPDAANGLEIGFYDLRLTRLLRKRMDLTSVDLPRHVGGTDKRGLVFADIRALPFASRTFDLTICTEVLEHLSTDVLAEAATELMRSTKRYLLVSVPFEQRIEFDIFRCAHCGWTGNTMGHVQSFDERRLRGLFGPMRLLRTELMGSIVGRAPGWLYALARRIGNVYFDHALRCPSCGQSDQAVPDNSVGYILRRVIWRLERRAGQKPAWIAMLFEHDDQTSVSTAPG